MSRPRGRRNEPKDAKTYNNQGRLLSTAGQTAATSPINSFVYTYDAAGQRKTETASTGKRDFTYDAWRQLTLSVKTVSSAETDRHSYNFDSIGNRLQVGRVVPNEPSALTAYTPNSVNQYSAITGAQADTPAYDANGNTTATQGLTLAYDEENRLISAASATQRQVYVYDALGRRVERQEYTGSPGAWNLTLIHRFVYDGWRVMEDLVSPSALQSFSLSASYTRGLDLSGSDEGAGGIGGLLGITVVGGVPSPRTASYFYDGNGNVTDLAFDDGTAAAHYEYSPFGERLVATGTWADTNPYQFSSKERDSLTGFYYYGLRYYSPATGRWINRDPINEKGGENLYAFVGNDGLGYVDPLGLEDCQTWSNTINIKVDGYNPPPIPLGPSGASFKISGGVWLRLTLSGKRCKVCCGGDNQTTYRYEAKGMGEGGYRVQATLGWQATVNYEDVAGFSADMWFGGRGTFGGQFAFGDTYTWGGCNDEKFNVALKTSIAGQFSLGGQVNLTWRRLNVNAAEATGNLKVEGFESYFTFLGCDETGCHGGVQFSNGKLGSGSISAKFGVVGFGTWGIERSLW